MEKLTADDPETHSADIVAENVEQLKALFPEAFTEGKVDFEVLKQLLGGAVEEREEKYGLNWHGKRRARQLALTPSTGTLRPCPEESVDWDTTQNLMIEGDNLEVLKLLQKSYAGKVKLIYIDPPYNTGNDLIYSDNFRDSIKNYQELTGQTENGQKLLSNTEASGRFHTDWSNMIYPRLRLGRQLLRFDGIMLVSINDHEVASLRFVCNEIFGDENFIATMVWEKGRKNDAKLISVGHEYVLVFAKSLQTLRSAMTVWREEKAGASDIWEKYLELRSRLGGDDASIERQLQSWFVSLVKSHPAKKWSRYKRVDANGPWRDRDISWPGGGGPRYELIHPVTGVACKIPDSGWRFDEATMQRQIKAGLVAFREDHREPPFRKAHIRPIAAEAEIEEAVEGDDDLGDASENELATQVRGTYFYKQSQVAVKQLRLLMDGDKFDNPKDHGELARLFDYVTASDKTSVVLDFFAGSGSSAHAVMALNQRDGGHRRFILVQLPEVLNPEKLEQKSGAGFCDSLNRPRNIAELTKERLRRAAAEFVAQNPMFAGDLGFRVFKLDSSNIHEWQPNRDALSATLEASVAHLRIDRAESDILYELLLKLGLDLCVPTEKRTIVGKTVHSIGGGVLIACLAESITSAEVEPLAQGIVALHASLAPAGNTTCVFRDSAFTDDVAKTNLAAILNQHGLANVRSL